MDKDNKNSEKVGKPEEQPAIPPSQPVPKAKTAGTCGSCAAILAVIIITVVIIGAFSNNSKNSNTNSNSNKSNSTTSTPKKSDSDSNSNSSNQNNSNSEQSAPKAETPKRLFYSLGCSGCQVEACQKSYNYSGWDEGQYLYYRDLCYTCNCIQKKIQSVWR